MIWEALGSGLLGLALAWMATRRLSHRLPSRTLVLPTGAAGGLLGAFVALTVLGSGHVMVTLTGALAIAAALLSLLLRPSLPHRRNGVGGSTSGGTAHAL